MVRRGTILTGLTIAVFTFLLQGAASAAIILVGDLQPTGSSKQHLTISGIGEFNRVDVHVENRSTKVKGDAFEDLDISGWTSDIDSDNFHASIGGRHTDKVSGALHFTSEVSESFAVCLHIFDDDRLIEVDEYHHDSDGSSHLEERHDEHGDDHGSYASSVPEPGTMLLLGSGLFGLASFGRKTLRRK